MAFIGAGTISMQMCGQAQRLARSLTTGGSLGACATASSRTIGAALNEVTIRLEAASVPEPELNARYLVSHVLGSEKHGDCFTRLKEQLGENQKLDLEKLVMCRVARMPIQYLVGSWDFHSIKLQLRPPVFIPRPESEQLVDLVLERLGPGPRHILEIGPGSGAISLALLSSRQDLIVTAVERSTAAVELCQDNAKALGVEDRINVIQGKVEEVLIDAVFDAVVSNPPYILRKDLTSLAPEIYLYEDLRALDGGAEGLDVILPILELSSNLLKDKMKGFVALEVDPCHSLILPPKLERFYTDEIVKDFLDKDRFMILRLK